MEIDEIELTALESARAMELIRENWEPLPAPMECASCGTTMTTTQVGGEPACSPGCALELAER